MKTSEPFVIANSKLQTSHKMHLTLVFVHTDNDSAIAEIRADGVKGLVRVVRKNEHDWITLEDSLDRNSLYILFDHTALSFDIEKLYYKYIVDMFVT